MFTKCINTESQISDSLVFIEALNLLLNNDPNM